MGTAAQIRACRIRAGKSAREVAEHLGLNDAWYHDLEQHDDELASTLTLFQGMELASLLGVQLRDLLTDDAPAAESISLLNLPSHIKAHVAREGISIKEFEGQVGWELREFLQSPIKAAAELPIEFLKVLAGRLDVNWHSLIPDEHAVQASRR